jgi:hypothetical protein
MQITKKGWVVINIGHPLTGNKYIVDETFSPTRSKAIKLFINDSGVGWHHWRKKYNFRVVRAEHTVSIDNINI